MAQRDRSQGFGFVYVDVATLLKQAKTWNPSEDEPQGQTVNFNKDPKPAPTPVAATPAPKESFKDRSKAVQEIQSNLDRLQALHHKLHAMLEELNQAAGTNGKKKS